MTVNVVASTLALLLGMAIGYLIADTGTDDLCQYAVDYSECVAYLNDNP